MKKATFYFLSFVLFLSLAVLPVKAQESVIVGQTGEGEQLGKGKPVCSAIGTRSEGWYLDGKLIKWENCVGCEAVCQADGWYAGCIDKPEVHGKLIMIDTCVQDDVIDQTEGEGQGIEEIDEEALAAEEKFLPTPGSPLYFLQGLREKFEDLTAGTAEKKAEVAMRQARRRVLEMRKLTLEKRGEHIDDKLEKLQQNYEEKLQTAEERAEKAGEKAEEIKGRILERREIQEQVLQKVLEKAPDAAKPALQKVIERHEQNTERFMEKFPKIEQKIENRLEQNKERLENRVEKQEGNLERRGEMLEGRKERVEERLEQQGGGGQGREIPGQMVVSPDKQNWRNLQNRGTMNKSVKKGVQQMIEQPRSPAPSAIQKKVKGVWTENWWEFLKGWLL